MPTASPPRQRRSTQERQVQIADAALRVIASKGIAAFTMDQLAREVGMTSGALFRHFASKEAILEAAVERAEGLLLETIPPLALPPLARLRAFVEARTQLVGSSGGLAQLIFSEQFLKALDEASRLRLQGIVEVSVRFLIDSLSEAQAEHLVRADLPAEDLARLVMGTILADIFLKHAQRDRETLFARAWGTLEAVLRP